MDNLKLISWNVCGLNSRAHRDNVRTLVDGIRADIVCLQETKLSSVSSDVVFGMLGMNFVDYAFLPAKNTRGGVLIGARGPAVALHDILLGCFSITVRVSVNAAESWWLTAVYGPQEELEKELFLEELAAARDVCSGAWVVVGDFNLILDLADKNNDRINRRQMRLFRHHVGELELQDLLLHGRVFTWSNEREQPTLVRLDRVLVSMEWEELHPNSLLQAFSSDASDHSPLVLQTNFGIMRKPRFHFECFWPKLEGYQDALIGGWRSPRTERNPYHRLDACFWSLIRELQSWSARRVGLIKDQLAAAREIILKLDRAQDFRALSEDELSLRAALKQRVLGLSSLERTMARQRARIRFLSEGDANTKYFHLLARGKKKRIFIPALSVNGAPVSGHEGMEDAIFQHFNSVFGSSVLRSHGLNLSALGYTASDLSAVDSPFTTEEVWAIIKELPSDRALGPDGFNGAFYKTAWPVIRREVMQALVAFHEGSGGGFHALNNGLIVLLPKKSDASQPSDFRPIAMIHSFGKLVSKILATCLAPLLSGLVSCNQTAFVRGRALHNSYKYVQCAAAFFRRKKLPVALLKIDISKAFDTISWSFLLEVLQELGFSRRWRDWMTILLSTASSRVLLNGRPGPDIVHRRGVRQGDSLSPMLFILAMDAFNRLVSRAGERRVLTRPGFPEIKYQCSFYTDDVILFLSASRLEADRLKRLLHVFGEASGLKANLSKCSVSFISTEAGVADEITQVLGCSAVPLPIKYLGLPLSSGPIPKSGLHRLVDSVAKKLPSCHGPLMSRSGRLVWIKSVLTAMPIFAMMANKLPAWVIKDINSICKRFFWAGTDSAVRGKCLVAWPVVIKPTELGGLGVLDLKLFNIALQTRWLWLQRVDEDRVWSGLPIKAAAEVRAFFEASIFVKVRNGRRTLFWHDKWLDGLAISDLAPDLRSVIPRQTANSLTVAEGLMDRLWVRGISGGLSVTIVAQYLTLWERLERVQLHEDEDKVVWKWAENGIYSAKTAYRALHLGSQQFPEHQLIWKSWLPLRVKIFLWLAHRRWLWTADRRRRHGLEARELCWLCDHRPESCHHLLVECRLTTSIWEVLFTRAALSLPPSDGSHGVLEWWRRIRSCWPPSSRMGVDTLFGLVSWVMWREHNACCFNGVTPSFSRALSAVRDLGQL
ncbi:hypothetical protein U9M48_012158 [Paspalum notatum var. saurae]|uniref:Reverse transcriptase domain-containing protein n=1 Tax=Paspalum notatum var. saurae TaxID=547442 RepID=A0AAQ3SYF3_PASNO